VKPVSPEALAGIDPEAAMSLLLNDVNATFDLNRLSIRRSPLRVAHIDLDPEQFPNRINQCLVKGRGTRVVEFGPFDSPTLRGFVDGCLAIADTHQLDWASRYLYVTVDTAPVVAGSTQRVPGWHFDDLQGPDIVTKEPGGFLFVSASSLPTEFAIQRFDTSGMDDRTHNVFNWCGRQVLPQHIHSLWPNSVALLSAYDVHRAIPAVQSGPRVFLRLLMTHCALTSTKTTINPAIAYDHVPHSTNGHIPPHLR
jgi:hypothetical protein